METSDAIILKMAPYSETTLLVTLLTREHGVVRALAKGARRGSSMQAAYEPFAWIEGSVRFKEDDHLGSLYSPRLTEGWAYLRTDLNRFAYAGVGLEVIGLLAAQSPADPFFFEEALGYLTALRDVAGPGSLLVTLLIRLLHHSGFPPQMAELWTVETLPPALTYHFDRGLFELPSPKDSHHAMVIPGPALAPLLPALRNPPPLEQAPRLSGRAGAAALRWLVRVWEDHLNTKFNSSEFLEKMVLRARAG